LVAGAEGKQPWGAERGKAGGEVVVHGHAGVFAVVQSRPAQARVFHREAQRAHQVQVGAAVRAQADHVAGVGWNLWLEQDHMEHRPIMPCARRWVPNTQPRSRWATVSWPGNTRIGAVHCMEPASVVPVGAVPAGMRGAPASNVSPNASTQTSRLPAHNTRNISASNFMGFS